MFYCGNPECHQQVAANIKPKSFVTKVRIVDHPERTYVKSGMKFYDPGSVGKKQIVEELHLGPCCAPDYQAATDAKFLPEIV